MPKLWTETVEQHRGAVRNAVLNALGELVAERGLRGLTMAEIAVRAGVGRATLYKYFPDVDAALLAWHERQVAAHFRELVEASTAHADTSRRLRAVLERFARIAAHRHQSELAAMLHAGAQLRDTEHRLHALVADLIREGAEAGELRADVPADELATYCLHALTAAGSLRSKAATVRLVDVVLAGVSAGR